jgi:hypothetical protein
MPASKHLRRSCPRQARCEVHASRSLIRDSRRASNSRGIAVWLGRACHNERRRSGLETVIIPRRLHSFARSLSSGERSIIIICAAPSEAKLISANCMPTRSRMSTSSSTAEEITPLWECSRKISKASKPPDAVTDATPHSKRTLPVSGINRQEANQFAVFA